MNTETDKKERRRRKEEEGKKKRDEVGNKNRDDEREGFFISHGPTTGSRKQREHQQDMGVKGEKGNLQFVASLFSPHIQPSLTLSLSLFLFLSLTCWKGRRDYWDIHITIFSPPLTFSPPSRSILSSRVHSEHSILFPVFVSPSSFILVSSTTHSLTHSPTHSLAVQPSQSEGL